MSSYFPLPTQDPNQVNPYAVSGWGYGPYAGWQPGSQNGVDTSQIGFAPHGNEADVNPNASMEDIYAANRDTINTTGNLIGQEAGNQLNYYGGLQQNYTNAENNALNQLQQTPGYTPGEASQINVNYGQFNTSPAQTSAEQGNPNAPVDTLNQGIGAENAANEFYGSQVAKGTGSESDALAQYGQNLGAQVNQSEGWSGAAANQFGQNVSSAAQGLGSGLQGAQSKFGALDTAVGNPALAFDPNSTEKQMSDQDVQNLVTSAGTTVGNQFQTAEDALQRQAAAQGNTSPLALAAARQQLVTQEGATAGDVMTNAQIAAQQAQFGRAQGIEQQREGQTNTATGLRATAATTEEAAAQAAAGQSGLSNIAAQEAVGSNLQNTANLAGQNAINAANQYGANSLEEQNVIAGQQNQYGLNNQGQQTTQTNQQYGAATNAEQLAAQRAQAIANQQYGQGVGSQQLTSQGSQTVGNARIAGQGAYRSGVAQQGSQAQTGTQSATQAQLGAYGTQTQGANASASGQGNFEVGKPSFGDTLLKGTAGAITSLFDKGGIVNEPTLARVAEHGPEWVGPVDSMHGHGMENPDMSPNVNALQKESVRDIGRYRRSRKREDESMWGVAA